VRADSRHRWFVVAIFFFSMLLHEADKLLIGSLTPEIMATFRISMAQMGAVSTGALIVGTLCYPLWGYLYDRYGRVKLLALASFVWGATTWLNGLAPSYPAFLAARATTGIDDSSYPGIYSLMSDYFGPAVRGKIYGLLEVSMPVGYLLGMILALTLGGLIGWRGVFYLTGTVGVLLAFVIYFGVREPARGGSEPELKDLEHIGAYRFNWPAAKALFAKRSLRLLFLQGFFGAFPWNVIALFIPFAAPNVISTVHDVSLPEVRSTALGIQYLIESSGAALAPMIAGLIADRWSLQTAILLICVSTWLLCGIVYA
jgi:MFS family permease